MFTFCGGLQYQRLWELLPVATVPSEGRKHHLHLTFSNQRTNLFSDISVFSLFRRQLRVHQAEKYNPRHVRH